MSRFTYCCAECHYAQCHYAECRNAECHYAECRNTECHYAECHYVECRNAECRGAFKRRRRTWSNFYFFSKISKAINNHDLQK